MEVERINDWWWTDGWNLGRRSEVVLAWATSDGKMQALESIHIMLREATVKNSHV
jgi:hypothetical protein